MLITTEQIKKFKQLYKNRFGKEISDADAYEQGIKLVRLMQIICKTNENKDETSQKKINAQKN